jgi:hypothetical protein
VSAVERHADEVAQLRQPDDDRRGRGEAADDRVRQEVDEDAAAQQAEAELDDADEQRQGGREDEVVGAAGLGEPVHGLEGQQRDDRDRPHRQRPRRADQRVGDQRQGRGDQPADRRHAGQQRVGHALRDQHHGDGQAREQVGARSPRR